MACKDCIHFESCKNLYETHGEGLSGDSYVCDFFKDRSRFVELPCKLGDTKQFPFTFAEKGYGTERTLLKGF